jgi:uncharacterized Ntn-hydrolase superfamily protein
VLRRKAFSFAFADNTAGISTLIYNFSAMKRLILLVLFASVISPFVIAQTRKSGPLVHTFSIVARDPQTGEMGVAVQSHWFSVGSIVTWAEAGVGAIATQSFVEPAYGQNGLALMRTGTSAPNALVQLLKEDKARNVRQVAFIDAQGRVAAWTGAKDIQAAGDIVGKPANGQVVAAGLDDAAGDGMVHIGEGYSVQANMMLNENIWPAMDKAFRETKGELVDRMLAALDAAQSAGGDIRGKQSAAIVIVKAKSSGKPWQDRIFDLRVDDNPLPLKELRRLVALQRAYNHMNAGDLATEKGDKEGALREYGAAEQIARNTPDVPASRLNEMMYWHAVALVNMNRVEEALPIFKQVFTADKNWATMTPRLPKVGQLPDDQQVLAKIMAQAGS